MGDGAERRVLLCVAGLTPQIITESLYVLMVERGERVDEVHVITTLGGRRRIMELLLEPGGGKFFEFCREYGFDPAAVRFDEATIELLRRADGPALEDIRTVEENVYAGDQICEVVRGLTAEAGVRVHASAAGGRKTMGIYLTAAMQLFGRVQDCLSHVLVSEEFETHPEFFYKPREPRMLRTRDGREVSTASAEIYLADIPFIRLRGLDAGWPGGAGGSYGELVRRTQADLDLAESAQEMRLDLRGNSVTVADRSVRLPRREFFYYLLFIHLRRLGRGHGGFVALEEIGREDLEAVFRLITAAEGRERGLEEYELVAGYDFLGDLIGWVGLKYVAPEFETTFREVKSKVKRRFGEAGLRERYVITTRGRRGDSRYGIRFPPERVQLA
ncbi:MAG: CRISPR-associated ring nuclease Csm6 [Acidobacteriota bacterium]|nr:CRISPR-associated ring nuclease Csm6 [Acidobacteriota bacterium]